MKTARVSVGLAILLAWTMTSPLLAQGPAGSGTDSPDSYDFFGPRNAQFRTDVGDGVGYSKGFQTFGAFQSLVVSPDEFIFFLNPRGIITYLGDVSANAGAGFRMYDDESDRIFGGSFWYDHDNTGPRTYDQLGISLESLGQYLDVRVNGYMPTNDDRDMFGQFLNGNNSFFSNYIGIGRSTLFSTPLKGGDFEIGGLLPGIGDIGIRPYVGGYYYQGEGTGAAYGVRTRVEALITQDFWAQVAYTYDPLFQSNVTMALTWYYGSGQEPRWFQRIPVLDRMYQQVERQYRIAVYEELFNDTITALRAGGTGGSGGPIGTPIFVVHVDNTAPAGGDGTVEHPLNQLPTSTPSNVDIVFVNRGNNTANGYNHGITLNDWQRLLGEGVHHEFTSLQGTYALPGYTPGPFPRITNPAGDVVTLASHNEVSGFNIIGAGRHGIAGSGIVDFNINNVNIPSAFERGISLVNATGTGRIFDVRTTDSGEEGLRIANTGGDLELRIDRLDASNNQTGISLNGSGAANFNVIARNVNTSDSQQNGIDVFLDTGSSIVGLFDRITSNNNNRGLGGVLFGDGFHLEADASVASLVISHSTFNGNNLNGVNLIGTNGADMDIDLIDNDSTISNNLVNGVVLSAFDSNVNLTLRNNIINDNGGFGILAEGTNSTLNLIANDNEVRRNHGAAIAYRLNESGTGTLEIRRNQITGTLGPSASQDSTIYFGQGIDVRLNGSSNVADATAALTSGIIDGNLVGDDDLALLGNIGGGIFLFADQQTTLSNLTISNNLIARNGGDGIRSIRRDEAIVDNIVIDTNSIHDNNGDGIEIQAHASPNDVSDYTVRNNVIVSNAGAGANFFLEADAGLQVDMFDNVISRNGSHGIFSSELVNSAFDLRFLTGAWERNIITFNNGDGIELNSATSGLVIGSFVGSSDGNLINDNANLGIDINNAGTLAIAGNEIARNAAGGIDIDTPTFFFATIQNNFIHNNRALATVGDGDGIEMATAAGVGSWNVVASLNTIRDNAGRGVDILNRFQDQGSVTLSENLIIGNQLEGVYVINTASNTQLQNVPSTTPLNADGSVTLSIPRLFFTMTDNRVEGNGAASPATATGLMLRVGTSDGGYTFTDDGGFFGEGRGGVGATITGNSFSGNLGDDIYIDSFVSTVAPVVTVGTWTNTTFTVTTYQGDPLSRLDLTFLDNSFDSANINVAAGSFNAMPGAGAFYNDADATFKSRDINATDAGPFPAGGARQRNATRLGGRFGLPPATPGGLSDAFLYPGLGQSTFRLLGVAPPGNVGIFNPTGNTGLYINGGFLVDNFYLSPADANGITNVNGGPFGAFSPMPYGWNVNSGGPRPQ